MICCSCGKEIDINYGREYWNGIYCKKCADEMLSTPEDTKKYEKIIAGLQAENAALREQISKMIMPPCTLGDTLYITSFCFGDGYDETGNAVHTSGWQITETKVDEKNFYRMCDLVRNEIAFFSREAAERELEELVGKCKCEFEHIEEEK